MNGKKWTRRTTRGIAQQLPDYGISISARTVARLLSANGYALRVNHKKPAGADHPLRSAQFKMIEALRERCVRQNIPLISIDTKKKELVGRFRNQGATWSKQPELVNDHDFRSMAEGIAVPYGIYDVMANLGSIYVGKSSDTPQFAAECVARWWKTEGQARYPEATELVILADSGGSNGCRPHAWKYFLQQLLANDCNLQVRVAHYPSGTSKWNPIEHRLFSEVSKHWAGVPLESFEVILKYLNTTKTSTGLRVSASMVEKEYEKGIKIPQCEMDQLNITKDPDIPSWNYLIAPQPSNMAEHRRCLN